MDLKLAPLHGLWTTPCPLSMVPLGSMSVADNVCFRQPGVLEPLPNPTEIDQDPFTALHSAVRFFDARPYLQLGIGYKSSTTEWETRWFDVFNGTDAGAISLYGADPQYEEGQVQGVYFPTTAGQDGRYYLTSKTGLIRFDTQTQTVAQRAGLPKPSNYVDISGNSTDARALQNGNSVNYRYIFRRVFADGKTPEYTSPPTDLLRYNVTTANDNPNINVYWKVDSDEIQVISGSTLYAEVYRTKQVTTGRDPGDDLYFVGSAEIDSAAITAGYASISDRIQDDELGEALYTNVGFEGIGGGHYQSPKLADVCEYKGTLYGIATAERQSLTLYVGVPWGSLGTDAERANGIGRRSIAGTIGIGNPTITNISDSHIKGVAVGQRVAAADTVFPGGKVISFTTPGGGVNTITMSVNAATAPASFNLYDVLELDGVEYIVWLPGQFTFANPADASKTVADIPFEFTFAQALQAQAVGNSVRGQQMTIHQLYVDGAQFGVCGTNGDKYSPPLDVIGGTTVDSSPDEEENRIAWSGPNQPDHWPLGNRESLGNGTLLRLLSTAEAMFAFSTEGRVYRISGQDSDLVVDVIMEGIYLASPNAAAAWGGSVYAWTNRGVFEIGDGAQNLLSRPIQRDLQTAYGGIVADIADGNSGIFNFDAEIQVEHYNQELYLRTSGGPSAPFIYHLEQGEWSKFATPVYAMCHSHDMRALTFVKSDGGSGEDYYRFRVEPGGPRIANGHFKLNRMAVDEPGIVKQFRQTVFLFQESPSSTAGFTYTAYIDKATGATNAGGAETPLLSATAPTPHHVSVGADAGFTTQWWCEADFTTTAEWALDGLVIRYEPLADRTGNAQADPVLPG